MESISQLPRVLDFPDDSRQFHKRCSSPIGRGRGPRIHEVRVRLPPAASDAFPAVVAQPAEAAGLNPAHVWVRSPPTAKPVMEWSSGGVPLRTALCAQPLQLPCFGCG